MCAKQPPVEVKEVPATMVDSHRSLIARTEAEKLPLVSVVMPVRNGALYLREAIESILGQSLTCLELIVVDGRAAVGNALRSARDFLGCHAGSWICLDLHRHQSSPSSLSAAPSSAEWRTPSGG